MRASCASGRPPSFGPKRDGNSCVSQMHKTVRSMSCLTYHAPVHPSISCTDMTELDFEFQTVCHRTIQAEKRLARQQALIAVLAQKGEPVETVTATIGETHMALGALRARRAEMAKKLRVKARKSLPR